MGTIPKQGLWARAAALCAAVAMIAACSDSGSDGPPVGQPATPGDEPSQDSGEGGTGLFIFGGQSVQDTSFITNDLRGSTIEIDHPAVSLGSFTDISLLQTGTEQVAPAPLAVPIDDDSAFVATPQGEGGVLLHVADFESATLEPMEVGVSAELFHPDHPGVVFGRGTISGEDTGCYRVDGDGEVSTVLVVDDCQYHHSGKVFGLDLGTGELVIADLDAEPGDEVRMAATGGIVSDVGVDDTGTLAWIRTNLDVEMFDADTGEGVAEFESEGPIRTFTSGADAPGLVIAAGGSQGTNYGVEPRIVYYAPDGSSVELDQTGDTPSPGGVMVSIEDAWIAPDASAFLVVHETFGGADGMVYKLDQFDADGTYVETLFEGPGENKGTSPSALPSFYLDVFEGPDRPIIVWRIRPADSDVWEPYLGTLGEELEALPEEEDAAEPSRMDRTEPDLAFADPETGDVAFVDMVRVRYVSGGDPTDVTDVALESYDEPGDGIRAFGDGRVLASTQDRVVRIDADGAATVIEAQALWRFFGMDDDGNIVLSHPLGSTSLCDGEDCSDPVTVSDDHEVLVASAWKNPSVVFGICTATGPGAGARVVRTCWRM